MDDIRMTLDGVEQRFHVRERDNRVAVVLSQPGWAAAQGYDYWYVSIEDLLDVWTHRQGSTSWRGGMPYAEALKEAKILYTKEVAVLNGACV